ncbi:TetR/AcrR family transcriptional regulator [Desulfoprunum benzoelyticum]|uniref:AcrR family transcriptional regulator n=1 Tax=Desulfoprunum benzoelyticum TaxID=1506996 RepID=A0A840V1S2_9BACT|nr:TetR/AcrR family transcriptional regulator [Desulfoprunum benzoelyticum]MBB5349614.1 AcrR family transcriptional regulator [Desulfoprunum benzoelyticum]MBM9531514.1 TetR/AcrR family transcriptional regulator [Desulfoprunum benzoelyticum]
MDAQPATNPPGKLKIIDAMRTLLDDRTFESLTISEIAASAGVTEGLIYKYFKDKRDLLHHVLKEHYEHFLVQLDRDLQGIDGALNKLKKIIWSSIERYANHRVFARIILLEVRNSEEYFRSEAYALVRQYNRIIIDIINEGIANGEIRDTLPPAYIRNAMFGAIEHSCLNRAIFNEPVSTTETAQVITELLFHGIKR